MATYSVVEVQKMQETFNDIDKNFDVIKEFIINSKKKFAHFLENEEVLLLKIQLTESNLRQYVALQIETL